MKIVVLNGSPRKGNTYEATRKFMKEIQDYGEISFKEFFFPQDLPEFCRGCFQCFMKGESYCPHAKYVQPIVEAMEEADAFIFSSPVYALSLSAGMKSFLDHTAYMYINHRPHFVKKKAMVISTTAGAGLKGSVGYIMKNLRFWGLNKVYGLGIGMFSIDWASMPSKKKTKAESLIKSKAKIFYKDVASNKYHAPSFIQVMMFNAGRAMMDSYDDTNMDKNYWVSKGYTQKNRNYFLDEIRFSPLKLIIGRLTRILFANMMKPQK